jgi:hypothetical protein
MNHLSSLAHFLSIRAFLIRSESLWLFVSVVAGILALLIAYWMIRLIWRIRWRSQINTTYIHLRNLANVPSVVEVGTYTPGRDLKFTYTVDGALLPVRKINLSTAVVSSTATTGKPKESPTANVAEEATINQAQAQTQASNAASSAGKAINNVQEKAQKVSGITLVVIDILGTLGSILPGALGESLKQKSTQLQAQKAAILAKGQAPTRGLKQIEHLKSSVGDLKEDMGQVNPPAAPQSGTQPVQKDIAHETRPPVLQASSPAREHAILPDRTLVASGLPCSEYVQLPPLAPAAVQCLTLHVSPVNPYYHGESSYWVYTRPQDYPDRLPIEASQAKKDVKQVSYAGMPFKFWLLSSLLTLIAISFNGAWFYLIVRWLSVTLA